VTTLPRVGILIPSAERLIDFVKGDDTPDVIMLSCTNLQTLHIRSDLTTAAGAPLVTSNLAAARAVRALLERL
jgi:maleate cis-trans isomerase